MIGLERELSAAAEMQVKLTQALEKHKHHPGKPAVVFMLLPGCPLRWAQYLITLQPILHVTRARLLQFPDGAACRFRKAPRLKAPNRLVCAHR